MTHLFVRLSSTRRKRKAPEGHTTREQLAEFQELTSVTLHSASTPGIVSVDVNPQNASLLCTAGQDKNVLIYDKDEDKTIATLKGHTKAVHKVLWHPSDECILSASADKTVKAWKNNGKKWAVEYTLKTHERDVTSLSIHPSGNYFLSASMDGTWALNDFNRGETVLHYDQQKEESGYAGISFHPDGVLFASGSASESGIVKLWDVKSQQVPFQCPDAHAGSANSLVFSENGYYFATAGSEGSVVKIWDLRKMQKIQEIDVEAPVQAVRFDYSGQYLAVGSADVRYVTSFLYYLKIFIHHSLHLAYFWQNNGRSWHSLAVQYRIWSSRTNWPVPLSLSVPIVISSVLAYLPNLKLKIFQPIGIK